MYIYTYTHTMYIYIHIHTMYIYIHIHTHNVYIYMYVYIYTPYICHISHISHGRQDWGHLWSHSKKSWCCDHQDVGCGHWEKVVHVVQTYDCHAGFKNLGVFRWLDGFDDWMVGFFVPDGKSLLRNVMGRSLYHGHLRMD